MLGQQNLCGKFTRKRSGIPHALEAGIAVRKHSSDKTHNLEDTNHDFAPQHCPFHPARRHPRRIRIACSRRDGSERLVRPRDQGW